MALRMGIGDVFTLCKSAADVCTRAIHEEHESTNTLITEMRQIRTHLKSIEAQLGDERAFAKTRPEIEPIIKRSLEPLHRDLTDLRATIHSCSGSRKPSIHVVDQVRYLVLYKAKLDGFQRNLPTHRASIAAIQDLIESRTPSERRESIMKLDEFMEEQERNTTRADEHEKAQNQVVSMFERRISGTSPEFGEKLSVGQILESLEDDLVDEGMERKHAEQVLFPITKALLRQPILPTLEKISVLPNLEFKLDLFDARRESSGVSRKERKEVDVSVPDTRSDKELAPDENISYSHDSS